jgi:hypothetical protein
MAYQLIRLLSIVNLPFFLGFQPVPQLEGRNFRPSQPNYFAGRVSKDQDKLSTQDEWQPSACEPDEARLIVVQITDVYTLDNLASVKTLIEQTKANSEGATVVSILTGDFLAPYLLSSIDRGAGMMNALAKIPIDYICWGNHEVCTTKLIHDCVLACVDLDSSPIKTFH